MTTDTPRTDEAEEMLGMWSVTLYGPAKRQLLDHARQLERENIALREALSELLDLQDQMGIHETPYHYDEVMGKAKAALAQSSPNLKPTSGD